MPEAKYRVHYTDKDGKEQYNDIVGVYTESQAEYVFKEFYSEFEIDFIEELN